MTDDELLDRWHAARLAHAAAPPKDHGETLFAKIAAEAAVIARLGSFYYREAYRRRYPDRRDGAPDRGDVRSPPVPHDRKGDAT